MTGEWVIKFPASGDMKDSGLMEKEYMDCAADCGIAENMPENRGGDPGEDEGIGGKVPGNAVVRVDGA